MANQHVLLKAAGLYTYFQTLMEIPPGALLVADNAVINRDGVIEPRRGIAYYGSLFGTSASRAKQLLEYKGRIFRHYDNLLAYDDGAGVFTNFSGTYTEPFSGYRIKSTETSSNFYFTTDKGVKKISATSAADFAIPNVIQDAGGPKAIDGTATINYVTVGFLAANSAVAYRILWGYKDRNGNLILGTPSMRILAENQSTIANTSVDLKFAIPYNVTNTDFFFRIYRSESTSTALTPSDELNLVFEGNPTTGELTAGFVQYTDFLSDSLRIGGTPLYTNKYSGEGALAANEPPPLCRDITTFKGHTFYANTRTRHKTIISLLSTTSFVSGTSSIVISDGTTTNTYTFVGAKESSKVTCIAKASVPNQSYFLLNNASDTRRYYIWYDKTGTSSAPSNAETTGKIGLKVNITASTTATDVALATSLAINAAAGFDFLCVPSGADVTITNTTNGNTTDMAVATLAPTGFTFTILTQGDGEDAALKHVLFSDNASVTQAVEDTARSLVNVINAQSSEIVSAFYLSGVDDVPGQILLERKTLQDTSFYVGTATPAIAASFNPELGSGATLTTKVVSENDRKDNRVYYSKPFEPEAVPILQYFDIGSKDQPIYRIVALRESLFVLKGDGIFRLTGEDKSSFNVSVFDNTSIIKAPDTAITLTNQCYFFGNQGIIRLNESSSEPISRPIENKLLPFLSTNPNLATASFAVAYESDRSLLLWTVETKTDTKAAVCYRYNTFTNNWTEWHISKTCAVLNRTEDKLYFGSGDANTLEKERKNFDRFDYADREIDSTLPSLAITGNVIKPTSFSSIAIEDVLAQRQYVTIYQFNMLLKKLDLDNGLLVHSFYDDLKMLNGDNLSNKMTALVAKLNIADPSMSYTFSGTTNFATIQTEYNVIIGKLNTSTVTYHSNYVLSSDSVLIESVVQDLDTILKTVTLNVEPAFMVGPLIIYKGIKMEIEYAPQHTGDPSTFKQFSQGTFMFERRSFYTAEVSYNSDASNAYEEIPFVPKSSGAWGEFAYGDGATWGGLGDQVQLRTYIPLRKQRCRFLGCKFKHGVALESLSLYGLSLTFSVYSERAYNR